ncbi:hypothetical protein IE077_004131 [Cardiosporidium cionae]|uniref:RNA-editing substrate-binding complex 6 protein domain-containing protein n=1 Tax=Cardiosporidium cionae TaxID=476202 RepID=A0ABQ7J6T9_9APIC|nr:hypothetical protein IE077_004131 [Cardiosporidium cionae]|eukprot:KAF8819678.1 hypothetical protein IE077_004131 [Cardiosporidium cionae]
MSTILFRRFFGGFLHARKSKQELRLGQNPPQTMSPSQLTYLIQMAAKKNIQQQSFWRDVTHRAAFLVPRFSADNIAFIINGFAKIQYYDADLLHRLIARAESHLSSFYSYHLAILLNGLVRLDIKNEDFLQKVATHIVSNPQLVFEEKHLALLFNAYSRFHFYDTALLNTLSSHTCKVTKPISPQSIANIINGCYRLKYSNISLFQFLLPHILKSLPELTPQHIANIIQGLTYFEISDSPTLKGLLKVMRQKMKFFSPEEISASLLALSRIKCQDKELLGRITERLREEYSSFTSVQRITSLYALSKMEISLIDSMEEVWTRLKEDISTCNAHSLILLLYTNSKSSLEDIPFLMDVGTALSAQRKELTLEGIVSSIFSFSRKEKMYPPVEALMKELIRRNNERNASDQPFLSSHSLSNLFLACARFQLLGPHPFISFLEEMLAFMPLKELDMQNCVNIAHSFVRLNTSVYTPPHHCLQKISSAAVLKQEEYTPQFLGSLSLSFAQLQHFDCLFFHRLSNELVETAWRGAASSAAQLLAAFSSIPLNSLISLRDKIILHATHVLEKAEDLSVLQIMYAVGHILTIAVDLPDTTAYRRLIKVSISCLEEGERWIFKHLPLLDTWLVIAMADIYQQATPFLGKISFSQTIFSEEILQSLLLPHTFTLSQPTATAFLPLQLHWKSQVDQWISENGYLLLRRGDSACVHTQQDPRERDNRQGDIYSEDQGEQLGNPYGNRQGDRHGDISKDNQGDRHPTFAGEAPTGSALSKSFQKASEFLLADLSAWLTSPMKERISLSSRQPSFVSQCTHLLQLFSHWYQLFSFLPLCRSFYECLLSKLVDSLKMHLEVFSSSNLCSISLALASTPLLTRPLLQRMTDRICLSPLSHSELPPLFVLKFLKAHAMVMTSLATTEWHNHVKFFILEN